MNDHLSPEQVAAYSDRQLPPAERLAVSDHLAACTACRALVQKGAAWTEAAPRVFAGLIAAAREADGPPSDEAWRPDAALPPRTPEELAEMREFEARMAAFEPERFAPGDTLRESAVPATSRRSAPSWLGEWWQWLAAGGAVGIAAAVVLVPVFFSGAMRGPSKPGSARSAELVDGSLIVRADGGLEGMLSLPADLRDAVLETVRRRAAPGALLGTVTRGEASDPKPAKAADAVITPEGVIDTDRPTFRWHSAPAVSSEVIVEPSAGGDPISSGLLPPGTGEWTAPQPFARGRLYRWRLQTGSAATRTVMFKALAADAHARLETLRAGPAGRSHLALGVAYAREGMHAQAREEFQRLNHENARSPLARQLLDSAETWQ